jgi:hypothetical protein
MQERQYRENRQSEFFNREKRTQMQKYTIKIDANKVKVKYMIHFLVLVDQKCIKRIAKPWDYEGEINP